MSNRSSDSGDSSVLLWFALLWAVSSCSHYEKMAKDFKEDRDAAVAKLQPKPLTPESTGP